MASGESSFEDLVLRVLRKHIPEHTPVFCTLESLGRGKTLQPRGQPIVEAVAKESYEVRLEFCDNFIGADSNSMTTVLSILSRRVERVVRTEYGHNRAIPMEEKSLWVESSKKMVTALAEELSQLRPLLLSELSKEFARVCCDPTPLLSIRLIRMASFLLLVDLASVLDVREFSIGMLGCLVSSYYMIDWELPFVWPTEYDPDFLSFLGFLVASLPLLSSNIGSDSAGTYLELTSADDAWKVKLECLLSEDYTKPLYSTKSDIAAANDKKKNTSKPLSHHEENYNEDDKGNSDCKAQSKIESDRELWMEDRFLKELDSIRRESWKLADEDTGTFFYVPVSDFLKHSQEAGLVGKHNNVWEECMAWFKLNKSWSCMWCYFCNKSFSDQQSHMMHMEYVHKLALSHDESCLVPFIGKDYVDGREVGMDCEPNLEDFIACDSACSYFLVDTTKFNRIRIDEVEKLGSTKQKQFLMVFKILQDLLSRLRHLLSIKSKHLKSMGVLRYLRWHLFDQIHELDQQIKEVLGYINYFRHNLSNLCAYDFRLEILPSIASYIRFRFGRIGSRQSEVHDKIKTKLSFSSPGCYDLLSEAKSFRVEDILSGQVFIGRFSSNSALSFAYTRLTLKFVGHWSFEGHMKKISGCFRYGGLSKWGMGTLRMGESSLDNDSETSEMEFFRSDLDDSLKDAVMEQLYLIEKEVASLY